METLPYMYVSSMPSPCGCAGAPHVRHACRCMRPAGPVRSAGARTTCIVVDEPQNGQLEVVHQSPDERAGTQGWISAACVTGTGAVAAEGC